MMQLNCKKCGDALMKIKGVSSFPDIASMVASESMCIECQGHKNGEATVCKKCGEVFYTYNTIKDDWVFVEEI